MKAHVPVRMGKTTRRLFLIDSAYGFPRARFADSSCHWQVSGLVITAAVTTRRLFGVFCPSRAKQCWWTSTCPRTLRTIRM